MDTIVDVDAVRDELPLGFIAAGHDDRIRLYDGVTLGINPRAGILPGTSLRSLIYAKCMRRIDDRDTEPPPCLACDHRRIREMRMDDIGFLCQSINMTAKRIGKRNNLRSQRLFFQISTVRCRDAVNSNLAI